MPHVMKADNWTADIVSPGYRYKLFANGLIWFLNLKMRVHLRIQNKFKTKRLGLLFFGTMKEKLI